jgi:hypothetical protein
MARAQRRRPNAIQLACAARARIESVYHQRSRIYSAHPLRQFFYNGILVS